MHKNEAFLKSLTDEEVLLLLFEAEEKGEQYLAALKEQLVRLDEE
jgi:hypothetical protein